VPEKGQAVLDLFKGFFTRANITEPLIDKQIDIQDTKSYKYSNIIITKPTNLRGSMVF